MAEIIQLEIVTPERRVVAEEVTSVVVPGADGYLGVLPGHAPLLARLQVGEVTYVHGGKSELLAISGGYVEVQRDSVNVLAETAESAGQIDLERARGAEKRARRLLEGQKADVDQARAESSLARALNRISTASRTRP